MATPRALKQSIGRRVEAADVDVMLNAMPLDVIPSPETILVPVHRQYIVYGILQIANGALLDNRGVVVVL